MPSTTASITDYGPVRFAGMAGSSIAAPDAAPWVTDFLNAACYRRAVTERQVDDLRLAFCILTTYWWRQKAAGKRLRLTDVRPFHRAFGSDRLSVDASARGTLNREQLLAGGDRLLGGWFAEAYADDDRRAYGVAFPTVEERRAYDPERRLGLARLGEPTPEQAPLEKQVWHTYPPVAMPSAEGVIATLTRPERWPDLASEIGRFTPLRAGGLAGQTFEIEVAAGTDSGRPMFTRGYVSVTRVAAADDAAWWDALAAGLAQHGEPPAVPAGARPVIGFDLTTHQGHFMGAGHNRVLLFEDDRGTWARAAGTWDPMSWHVDRAYRRTGQDAQRAFWTDAEPAKSMFCQLAARA